jgi:hypothetical protein
MTLLDQLTRTILLCRDYLRDGVSDAEICRVFQGCRVLCVSDLRNLSSHSGQTALVALVSLLSRLGMKITLDIPEVNMIAQQPPLSGVFLRQSLLASSERLVTGATVGTGAHFKADLTFVLGDTQVKGSHCRLWRLTGTEWFGALASEGTAHAWTAKWPIGSLASAALAAGEAFKFVMRNLPVREEGVIMFEPSMHCEWDFGSIALPTHGIDLGEIDIISAGAICQSVLYTLARIPEIHMHGRIFDHDVTAPSNLNRNMLTLTADVGLPKVRVIAERCGANIRLEPVPARFGKSETLCRLAQRVLVGVDDIPSRWEIQRGARGWLGVGGTSHFSISSSSHKSDEPCCGCLHYLDDSNQAAEIPTVSFVSFWAGLSTAVRLLRDVLGDPYSASRQHLWLTPLRMDQPHSAMWLPIPARRDCPVQCLASQSLGRVFEETHASVRR